MSDPHDGYLAVQQSVGLIDRSDCVRLDVTGPDRAKFLHNLTTNEVKRLADGAGHEAFVTSPQGKTLGYVTLLACTDRILLRTDPGGLEFVLPHLRKYGVFDDVALDDVSGLTFELHLAGPRAEELVTRCGGAVPPTELGHITMTIAGCPVRIIRESPTGRPGVSLIGDRADLDSVLAPLRTQGETVGLVALDALTFDALRIEAGTPVFGRDLAADNLPQEMNRDARAINFVKGCYLGQETVARLDALGHVNKLLRGLRCTGPEVPPAGTVLEAGGKIVGVITSAAFSPGWNAPVALAIVRTTHAQPGTEVQIGGQPAVVAELPMLPRVVE
ncbi:MAG: glycine cleavage T C-terminal barrel domain-containing protein [Isosphaeraceae bacterium]|nr:glycine cleavage T C-terminal barrel domain-containing protein [Isosphaeraceae bacterium]